MGEQARQLMNGHGRVKQEYTVVIECITYDRYRVEANSPQEAVKAVRSGKVSSFEEEVQSQNLLNVWDENDENLGTEGME